MIKSGGLIAKSAASNLWLPIHPSSQPSARTRVASTAVAYVNANSSSAQLTRQAVAAAGTRRRRRSSIMLPECAFWRIWFACMRDCGCCARAACMLTGKLLASAFAGYSSSEFDPHCQQPSLHHHATNSASRQPTFARLDHQPGLEAGGQQEAAEEQVGR